MAKLCMINREIKRQKIVNKYAKKRAELKEKLKDTRIDSELKADLWRQFHAIPRDASPCRLRNRCRISGRSNGYYRKFGLARNKLREAAMRGDVPGLVKASW